MPECLAALSCNGDGWLWKLESPSALPFHAQEDGRRDELWIPLGSPHGFGASLSGRRKVTCHFQRQLLILQELLEEYAFLEEVGAMCNLLFYCFALNNIPIHKEFSISN